jgi:hypothetical protein
VLTWKFRSRSSEALTSDILLRSPLPARFPPRVARRSGVWTRSGLAGHFSFLKGTAGASRRHIRNSKLAILVVDHEEEDADGGGAEGRGFLALRPFCKMIRPKPRSRIRKRRKNRAPLVGAAGGCVVVTIRTTLALLLVALMMLHQRLLLRQTSSMLLAPLEGVDRRRFLAHNSSTNLKSSYADSKAMAAAAEEASSSLPLSDRTLTAVPTTRALQMTTTEERFGSDNDDDDEWLTMQDFDVYLDAFSDSWYMSVETFRATDLKRMHEIEAVEEACFVMFESREERVRMALDWLDFGVEHMSTWWKVLEAPVHRYAHESVVQSLDRYVADRLRSIRQNNPSNTARSLLRPTLALVAFQRYQVRGHDEPSNEEVRRRSDQLTVSSLSATIASLRQAGMGRIVVVGHDQQQDAERPLVHQAFKRFAPNRTASRTAFHHIMDAHGTQLAYVTVSDDMVKTQFVAVNVPRGALLGLRRALEGTDREWTTQWLGPTNHTAESAHHPWKFVYLTEPDTMLHVRPARLAAMERMLQRGMILVPHRLQPVPYEDDVPESNQTHTFITREQVAASAAAIVVDLDAADSGVACCDEQRGTLRPGPKAAAAAGLGAQCGWDRWWLCGFGSQQPNNSTNSHQGNHSLILDHYQLIRLRQGTGVTLVSGSSHGRRCFPTLNGTCTRRTRPPTQQALVRPKNPWITPKRLQERRARNQNAPIAATT